MRELKFRFWVAALQELRYFTLADIARGNFSIQYHVAKAMKNGDVEQYTGLKDLTGKEVYEGDIVGNTPGASETGAYEIVKWDEKRCAWMFGEYEELWEVNPPIASQVIIGNIHENADLLTPSLTP